MKGSRQQWQKYVHLALVNRLGGQSPARNRVVRLTDHPDMTIAVYRGCKTTKQQQTARSRKVWAKSADSDQTI